MALTDYSGLQDEVAAWLHRSDLTSRIPTFITLAEAELRLHPAVTKLRTGTLTLTADTASYALATVFGAFPSSGIDALQSVSLVHDLYGRTLEIVAPDEFDAQASRYQGATGIPQRITITEANVLELSPTPDDAYTLRITFREQLPSLSESATANWLLQDFPQIYLYATLAQAEPFLVNDERLPMWQAKLADALNALMAQREREQFPTQLVRRIRNPIGARR